MIIDERNLDKLNSRLIDINNRLTAITGIVGEIGEILKESNDDSSHFAFDLRTDTEDLIENLKKCGLYEDVVELITVNEFLIDRDNASSREILACIDRNDVLDDIKDEYDLYEKNEISAETIEECGILEDVKDYFDLCEIDDLDIEFLDSVNKLDDIKEEILKDGDNVRDVLERECKNDPYGVIQSLLTKNNINTIVDCFAKAWVKQSEEE